MKKTLLALFLCACLVGQSQNVGIGTSTPGAKLDINSANSGILIPRMALTSTSSANPVSSPVVSTLVYNTATAGSGLTAVTPGFYYWNGSAWVKVIDNTSLSVITGPTGATGANGTNGTNGANGTNGSNGVTGSTGAAGNNGANGTTGATGSAGNNGTNGTNGTNGPTGATGAAGSANAWGLTGNTGTNSSVNFIGTPDTASLVFRVGNYRSGLIDLINNNTSFGVSAFSSNTTGGVQNTAIGADALRGNTTGLNNTATGFEALEYNTYGSQNTANGATALEDNTTGSANTANGFEALYNNLSSGYNTANGYQALYLNTGGANTASGSLALLNNTTGSNNSAFGFNAEVASGALTNAAAIGSNSYVAASNSLVLGSINGVNSATVSTNVGIGTSSPAAALHVVSTAGAGTGFRLVDGSQGASKVLTSDASGNASWQAAATSGWGLTGNSGTAYGTNFIGTTDAHDVQFRVGDSIAGFIETYNNNQSTALGYGALSHETPNSSDNNSAFGYQALYGNTTGSNNTANGYQVLLNNSTGYGNTASGFQVLSSNTTGNANTASGFQALYNNNTGFYNIANGLSALLNNTTGYQNSANGTFALRSNTTGFQNTANGCQALFYNAIGLYNTAAGANALFYNTNGNLNTATGYLALNGNNSGNENTANGFAALQSNTAGNNNTAVGDSADVASGNLTNATAIGANAYAAASNSLILGSIHGVNGSTVSAKVGIGTSSPAAALHVVSTAGAGTGFRLVDGSQGASKVLTSDASGNASWMTPASVNLYSSDGSLTGTRTVAMGNDTLNFTSLNGNFVFNTMYGSVAMGNQCVAASAGGNSVAMGTNSTASGWYSTALGNNTTATGQSSTALGNGSTASGNSSTALGFGTSASGSRSTAMGAITIALSYDEMVIGSNNTTYTPGSATAWISTDRLFGIGNGATSGAKSDAVIVLKNGNVGLGTSTPANVLHVVSTAGAGTGFRLVDSSQGAGKVLTSDASGNASWSTPAVAGAQTLALSANGDSISISGGNKVSMAPLLPPGSVQAFVGTAAPAGWLLCNGTSYSGTGIYANLYAVIASNFGGSGGNFNVPDLRGEFLRGVDTRTSGSNDPDNTTRTALNTGGNTGANIGSAEADAFQGHTHTIPTGSAYGAGPLVSVEECTNYGTVNLTANLQGAWPDGVHGTPKISSESRPINVYVNYIIKY